MKGVIGRHRPLVFDDPPPQEARVGVGSIDRTNATVPWGGHRAILFTEEHEVQRQFRLIGITEPAVLPEKNVVDPGVTYRVHTLGHAPHSVHHRNTCQAGERGR